MAHGSAHAPQNRRAERRLRRRVVADDLFREELRTAVPAAVHYDERRMRARERAPHGAAQ
jgi:hypothetical protein